VPDAIDLDHVAVAVEHHHDAFPRYAGDLGGRWLSGGFGLGFSPGQLRYDNGMKVELLRPYRVEENDFLRRFLDRNGPGPHHLTFKVPDLDAVLSKAETSGFDPINVDRSDADWQEAFLHPKAVPGVLIQIAQASGPDWTSERPAEWPAPRTDRAATLDRITHVVRDLDEGLRLYAGLLDGQELHRGADDSCCWVDVRWPGPGVVRVVSPTRPDSELTSWMGDRRGRIHHLVFSCERPAEVGDARAANNGWWEVPPEANLGVRLLLRATEHTLE
jgi:catechol 2,3-dioxygenase-like lactoylglutathione lyase family enzyme